jgi:hypothetical protein
LGARAAAHRIEALHGSICDNVRWDNTVLGSRYPAQQPRAQQRSVLVGSLRSILTCALWTVHTAWQELDTNLVCSEAIAFLFTLVRSRLQQPGVEAVVACVSTPWVPCTDHCSPPAVLVCSVFQLPAAAW